MRHVSGQSFPDATTPDSDAEKLFRESTLAALGFRIAHAVRASWLESRLRWLAIAVTNDWRPFDLAVALRATGWMMTVAAATTLFVQWLGAGREEPPTRALPIAAAAGGLFLWWLARPRTSTDGRKEP